MKGEVTRGGGEVMGLSLHVVMRVDVCTCASAYAYVRACARACTWRMQAHACMCVCVAHGEGQSCWWCVMCLMPCDMLG